MVDIHNELLQDRSPLDIFDISVLEEDAMELYKKCLKGKEQKTLGALEKEVFLQKTKAAVVLNGKFVPTVAGLLMFGREEDIRSVYPDYFLDYREETNAEDGSFSFRISSNSGMRWGNIFEFFLKVYTRLISKDCIHGNHLDHALSEALGNAATHADYAGRQGTVVLLKPQHICISNPGIPLITKQDLYKGGISDPRNPLLFRMFQNIGICSHTGSGVQKICKIWNDNSWGKPNYQISSSPDRVSLHLNFR